MSRQGTPWGIALMLTSLFFFAALDATAKHLSQTFAVAMLVWARYTVHCLFMAVVLGPSHRMRLIRTDRPGKQIIRALLLVGTTGFFMAAFQRMPMAETTAIIFLTPLIVTLLAGPMLGEQINRTRWTAIVLGMLGMLLIARPGGVVSFDGLMFGLSGAACYSLYQIQTRQLSVTEDTVTMLFYTALVGTASMTLAIPLYWGGPMPDLSQGLLIASLGLFGGTGHLLLTMAFRRAPASLLSPFLYVQLLWAVLLGWMIFGHFPDAITLLGMSIIAASGLWVGISEYRRPRGS